MTTDGNALTRVCVVDFSTAKVVCDQLSATNPDTDHITRNVCSHLSLIQVFSGKTTAPPDPMTMTFVDMQAHLLTLIKLSTIFLGHSLESELHGLKLLRACCIDPALLLTYYRFHIRCPTRE